MDDLSPISSPLESALVRYRQTLECLNASKTSLSPGQVLEILSARDALGNVWPTQGQVSDEIISQVKQLDLRLKQEAYRITQVLSLPEHRASFPVPPQQWWWHLEAAEESHLPNSLDGLCRGMRGFVWTVDLGLLATLATRLLSGGSGLIEIVALFQVNNELNTKGQKQDTKHYRHEVIKLIPPVFLLIALGFVWHRQPQIAGLFNQEGYNHQWPEYLEQCQGQTQNPKQCRKQLVQAEKSYLKAIAFDSENLDANYNLGTLYEDLQDFDNARKFYAIAAKGGLPDAYNNLARLLIQKKEYPQAVALLNQGIMALLD